MPDRRHERRAAVLGDHLLQAARPDPGGGDAGPHVAAQELRQAELTSIRRISDAFGSPASISLTAGSRIPSWKISCASFEMPPGTMPPTSFQCAMLAVHATSSPSANTGIASTTSLRWVTPP